MLNYLNDCAVQIVTSGMLTINFIFSPSGQNGDFPGLRYSRIAVGDYSFTSKCLDQKRLHFVKCPG